MTIQYVDTPQHKPKEDDPYMLVLRARAHIIASGDVPGVWHSRPPRDWEEEMLLTIMTERGVPADEAKLELGEAIRQAEQARRGK
jgi:hypothetical protein